MLSGTGQITQILINFYVDVILKNLLEITEHFRDMQGKLHILCYSRLFLLLHKIKIHRKVQIKFQWKTGTLHRIIFYMEISI